jgi:hypothetical protein
LSFDGDTTNGCHLTSQPNQNAVFGTGDFTVEFWVNFNSRFQNQTIMGTSFTNGWVIWQMFNATSLTFWMDSAGVGISTNGSLASNTWYHIAVTRASGTLRIFVDGVLSNSTSNTTNLSSTVALEIGNQVNLGAGGTLNGYLDDIRITKGYARYTANFTPPTAAFPTY